MKRLWLLVCIFGPTVIISLSVWISRSTHASLAHAAAKTEASSGRVVVPSGTEVLVRLVQGVAEGTKAGETLQALTAEATFKNGQMLIPKDTRALVEVLDIHKEKPQAANVTLRLNEFMFKDRNVRVHSAPITARLDRLTDLDLMSRAAGGLIGGAVGAAGSASLQANPNVGATAIGGLAAGASSQPDQEKVLTFQVVDPIDLTGIRW